MAFSPLPGPFLDEAGALASRDHTVLELGCGEGVFTARLRGLGLRVVGLDRARPLPTGGPAVAGDALAPPLRAASCDLVVAANLVRHLAARRPGLDFLGAWARSLRPGGALYVFEDAPRPAGGAAGHYGRLQDLLARLWPEARGPLLAQERCLAAARRQSLAAAGGRWPNTWTLDATPVLALLRGGRPCPGGAADVLAADIERDGIACGPAWWVRLAREDA